LTGGTESLASSGTGIPILLFQIIIAITDQGIAGIFSFIEEGYIIIIVTKKSYKIKEYSK